MYQIEYKFDDDVEIYLYDSIFGVYYQSYNFVQDFPYLN